MVCSSILVEEVNKLGERASRLDGLDSFIARCDLLIARQRALLDGGECHADDRMLVEGVLRNIIQFGNQLRSARGLALHWLEQLEGP